MTPFETAQLVLRILLAAVFAFMGVSHFVPGPRRAMRAMIPPALRREGMPSPAVLVAVTGVCELAGAVGLLTPWPVLRLVTGIALAIFLVAVFPANAYAAAHRDRFGATAVPFWPRLIGQVVLIGLVLFAVWPEAAGHAAQPGPGVVSSSAHPAARVIRAGHPPTAPR